ncbi:unconventional myosin-XVI [Sardina pilchardus]|uniref:unconventional myosin-XVI n=1 Tax=Sardina pilchardus TaxID=27697 RepID=UPI002E134FA8
MSHYHFIKCCCFQLCNVFRSQNMEIDQCLLESLPLGQRQRLVRRMRCDQVRAYYERERALQKQQCQLHGAAAGSKQHVNFPLASVIQDAVMRHDDKEVLKLLKEGADINTPLSSGGSLLHLCARHDSVFAAEVLMERGLNVNLQDEDLWTALHLACACDHPDMVLLLLLAGANVLLQDVNGNIPLDYATEGTESRYILHAHLEENGVDLSSLHLMRTQRSSTMLSDVRQLIGTGVSLNQHNEEGVTLLHMASASGYKEVVSLLLESGADPQVADNNYWTPLHLASKYGQTRIVSQLLKYKADPTLLNCSQDKASDVAASDHIADMLLRAEEFWVQHHKDPGVALPMPDENCEDLAQDVATPVKKLAPLAVPISKRDSLLEKDHMFRDVAGALSRQPSQDNGLDGPYPSTTSKLEQVKLMPPAPNDDLASLSELTDSSLLYEMQKRFGNDQIYTYIGHILLLVNPNKDLPIYSTLVSQLYLSSTGRLCSSLPPHIFSSAERAYHMMLQERRPQCFIISGESGSGKTEACKHLLKHLAARSSPKGFALEPRMKHVNCVLEAFGHAKTPMNPNSSRFTKLLTVHYCEKRRTILRARVHTYMLEKSRLIGPPRQQLSFGVFHLMAEGLTAEEKSSLYLNNLLAHRFLSGTGAGEAPAVGTASSQSRERLVALKQSLRALGLNKLEVENVLVVLSALLHLGDVRFTSLSDADAALPSDLQLLDRVSCMLQVNPDDLGAALTSDVQYYKGDTVTRRHSVDMSGHTRDLLAKAIYSRLFSYLVNNINHYLQGPDDTMGDPALEISILDIFGFEEFQKNSYEQLCINMTSERIQQYVTGVLFQQEQQECLQEGIASETLRSPGNQTAVLDFFFQKPQGVLSVVDEESLAQRWSEPSLYKRLQSQLDASGVTDAVSLTTKDGNGNPPPKDQGPSFTVSHYAGKMTYDLTGSLERNRDALPQNVLFVMKSSESVLVQQLFQCKLTQTGSLVPPAHHWLHLRGPKAGLLLQRSPAPSPYATATTTTATTTRDHKKYLELSKLVKKKAGSGLLQRLDRGSPITMATQLRGHCCGVVVCRYRELVDTVLGERRKLPVEERCRHVLQHCKLQGWQMGSSRVFLRYWQADHLNDRCHQLHKKIVTCQKVARGWLVRKRVRRRLTGCSQRGGRSGSTTGTTVTGTTGTTGTTVTGTTGTTGTTVTGTTVTGVSVQRFLQGAEELGLRAYDSLVLQNASDIARENDRQRGAPATGPQPLGERPEPVGKEEDSPKRPVEKCGRAHRHFRSSSVPLPLQVDNLVHSAGAGSSAKPAALQPVVGHGNEDGGGGGGGNGGGVGGASSPRKQPPPKPKRDPNTRLSASYEAVSAGLSIAPKDSPADADLSKPRPHSDDYSTMKKIPPPKPKRSPNTKLTGSYEEISAMPLQRPTDMKLRAASVDGPHTPASLSLYRCPGGDDEDVYIEMVGNGGSQQQQHRAHSLPETDSPETGEAVYEEMKYFPAEDGGLPRMMMTGTGPGVGIGTAEFSAFLPAKQGGGGGAKDASSCDIPAPFPNLLPHRPPLLIFPPSPVTCSPASDESPLTPLEVKKLPVFETNLNYSQEGGSSPLSPQYARQRADSSPSLSVLLPDRSTPPLTPPPAPAQPMSAALPAAAAPPPPPPPYRPPSHFPFPPEAGFLTLTRGHSGSMDANGANPPLSAGVGKPPYSPVKGGPSSSSSSSSRPEPRRAHSCSSSPLLFNPANGRALTSPLDELNTLFSSGRTLLRKSTGRKMRDAGFNSNINLPGREEQGPTCLSPQLQDKNANTHNHHNHHHSPTPPAPRPATTATSSPTRGHLNFSPFGAGAAL